MFETVKFKLHLTSIVLMALGLSTLASANVSLKNGNYFVGYIDLIYPGGFEPKLERVYNSKTPYKGIFGWGWGTEYEVYLKETIDGSIVAHEYGGGAENRFRADAFNEKELAKAVDSLVEAAKKAGITRADYRKDLMTNATYRNEEWEKFRRQGLLKPRQLPVGTELKSNRFAFQKITKVAGGYIRTNDNGKTEKFNEAGRLVKISDKNGNFIDFTYGKDGHMQKLVDNFNRKIFFEFNNHGLLTKLEGENGKKAEFKYNSGNELISSKDVEGNAYTYKYDTQNRHNLTEIGYSDKTNMAMSYYSRDKHENIKSVKDRDGTLTEYDYQYDKSDRGHIAVTVRVKGTDTKVISSSKYEYFSKYKTDGEEWTYKLVTVLDGDRTETIYNQCCGMPLIITHAGEQTTFEYDKLGHVTKKITPSEITELHYHPAAGKVDKVVKYSKVNKKQSSWSQFAYDNKANLVLAKNSDGKGVKLLYDTSGRIRTLIDQDRRQISFKYNENSKPVEITDPALGTITVSYTNSGEIKKVESSAGRKIALQVTSAFQNLLDIIRPAGVTLSF
jgi:YD repeat-containing protein